MKTSFLLPLIASVVLLASCVPQRKYSELDARKKSIESENVILKKENEQFEAQAKEMATSIETKDLSINRLLEDTSAYGKNYRQLRTQYDKVIELNDNLATKNPTLIYSDNVNDDIMKGLGQLSIKTHPDKQTSDEKLEFNRINRQ